MQTRLKHRHLFSLCFTAVALAMMAAPNAQGQSLYTASKAAEIYVFGGYSYVTPDFGPDNIHDNGITLGVDYARYFGWRVSPALEFRYTHVTGQVVNESTISGGLRGHFNLHGRYHPYVDALGGIGSISYNQPYAPNLPPFSPDHGLAISFGGGVDIDLVHNVLFKADYQYQSWNLGVNNSIVTSGADYTLSPTVITIGVSYRLPFRSYVGPQNRREKPEKAPRTVAPPAAAAAPSAMQTQPPAPDTVTPAPQVPAEQSTTPTPADQTAAPTTPAPTTTP